MPNLVSMRHPLECDRLACDPECASSDRCVNGAGAEMHECKYYTTLLNGQVILLQRIQISWATISKGQRGAH